MPGWLCGWAPAFGSGRDPRIQDRVSHQAPCEEPASPSAYVFASLSLSMSLMNKIFLKNLKDKVLHDKKDIDTCHSQHGCISKYAK